MKYLRLLTPYIAVGIFWILLRNAWLTIACYHLLILLLSRQNFSQLKPSKKRVGNLLALPTLLTGVIAYLLLPIISKSDINEWLTHFRLSGLSFILMIPYFSIVHPFLEEIHWTDLRESSFAAHLFFAGYHVLVLAELLHAWALLLCFIILALASYFWHILTRLSGSLLPSCLSHLFADTGVIIIAYLIK